MDLLLDIIVDSFPASLVFLNLVFSINFPFWWMYVQGLSWVARNKEENLFETTAKCSSHLKLPAQHGGLFQKATEKVQMAA